MFIDVACPMDHNVQLKEEEKIRKYGELKFEIEKLWKTKVKIVPVIIGALGAVSNNLRKHLDDIGLNQVKVCQLQKTVLLKTGNILRRHLAT